ncbi:MAG TPA: hypothetical protein VK994_02815 [Bacteroidales bacterium]|nr:hypothetical protein [Bacteroidales bacterium]
MKKLLIGFALVCFVAFGTISVQSVVASEDNVEIVKMNNDDHLDINKAPDGKKKKDAKATAEKKGECKDASAKSCETKSSCCSSKSAAKCDDKKETSPKKEGGDKK